MDCSPPGSSVYGILQARILEWVAISFSSHYGLLSTKVNSSWGPGARPLESTDCKKSQRIMHDQDIGHSPKMLRSSTGMSDAGGQRSRQDYLGAVSGGLWDKPGPVSWRVGGFGGSSGEVWGPALGENKGIWRCTLTGRQRWEWSYAARCPGPHSGVKVVFGQVSSQAALWDAFPKGKEEGWCEYKSQTHWDTWTCLSLIASHAAQRSAALFSVPQVKRQRGSNRDHPSSPVGGSECGRVFRE